MKAICQQASKSQTVIEMHVLKHPTVSLNHIFQLFDTLIKPILAYGCAVWGTGGSNYDSLIVRTVAFPVQVAYWIKRS